MDEVEERIWRVGETRMWDEIAEMEEGEKEVRKEELGVWPVHGI